MPPWFSPTSCSGVPGGRWAQSHSSHHSPRAWLLGQKSTAPEGAASTASKGEAVGSPLACQAVRSAASAVSRLPCPASSQASRGGATQSQPR